MNGIMKIVLGATVGALIGYAMYQFVGCRTGACPLTANPYIAVLLYALMGALVTGGR